MQETKCFERQEKQIQKTIGQLTNGWKIYVIIKWNRRSRNTIKISYSKIVETLINSGNVLRKSFQQRNHAPYRQLPAMKIPKTIWQQTHFAVFSQMWHNPWRQMLLNWKHSCGEDRYHQVLRTILLNLTMLVDSLLKKSWNRWNVKNRLDAIIFHLVSWKMQLTLCRSHWLI